MKTLFLLIALLSINTCLTQKILASNYVELAERKIAELKTEKIDFDLFKWKLSEIKRNKLYDTGIMIPKTTIFSFFAPKTAFIFLKSDSEYASTMFSDEMYDSKKSDEIISAKFFYKNKKVYLANALFDEAYNLVDWKSDQLIYLIIEKNSEYVKQNKSFANYENEEIKLLKKDERKKTVFLILISGIVLFIILALLIYFFTVKIRQSKKAKGKKSMYELWNKWTWRWKIRRGKEAYFCKNCGGDLKIYGIYKCNICGKTNKKHTYVFEKCKSPYCIDEKHHFSVLGCNICGHPNNLTKNDYCDEIILYENGYNQTRNGKLIREKPKIIFKILYSILMLAYSSFWLYAIYLAITRFKERVIYFDGYNGKVNLLYSTTLSTLEQLFYFQYGKTPDLNSKVELILLIPIFIFVASLVSIYLFKLVNKDYYIDYPY